MDKIKRLIDAMNLNNAYASHTAYAGYELTETRRKYHLLNEVLTNGQRSGLFLIDRATLDVYKSVAYGKAGYKIGTVDSLMASYAAGNASYAARGITPRTIGELPMRWRAA